MALKHEVYRLRKAKGWTQKELAAASGISQQVIGDVESGRTTRPRQIHDLAHALGTTPEALDPEQYAPKGKHFEDEPPPLFGPKDFPIYASAEGSHGNGSLVLTFEPIEFISRPAPLANVRGGFGMYVIGDSMAPAYEPGDIALVNPNLPPSAGRDAIIFQRSDNHANALIKRLVRATEREWQLLQWNPHKNFSLSRAEWPHCQIVVGKYNR